MGIRSRFADRRLSVFVIEGAPVLAAPKLPASERQKPHWQTAALVVVRQRETHLVESVGSLSILFSRALRAFRDWLKGADILIKKR